MWLNFYFTTVKNRLRKFKKHYSTSSFDSDPRDLYSQIYDQCRFNIFKFIQVIRLKISLRCSKTNILMRFYWQLLFSFSQSSRQHQVYQRISFDKLYIQAIIISFNFNIIIFSFITSLIIIFCYCLFRLQFFIILNYYFFCLFCFF